jgi:hypothetical protein
MATQDPSSAARATMAEEMRRSKQRLLEVTAQRRELRARVLKGDAIEPTSTLPLARAVAAVVNSLPSTGAVMMDWSEALRLAHLDEPSAEMLRELQDELRKSRALAAFGSRVVVFARDPV